LGCTEEGSSEVDMYVPLARERVQIIGRSGVFLVVRIDEKLQTADLFPLRFAIFIEKDVPFSDLEPYQETFIRPSRPNGE
jgi:hypothetical protein